MTAELPPGPRGSLPQTIRFIRKPYDVLRKVRARYGGTGPWPE
jgi:hypothetical protein